MEHKEQHPCHFSNISKIDALPDQLAAVFSEV
jgi:hypothetical protein